LNRSQEALFTAFQPIVLEKAIVVPDEVKDKGGFKCRLIYGQSLEKVEFEPYTFRAIRSLRLVDANHLDYTYKYLDRSALDALFQKRSGLDDILMVKNSLLTDTYYANVALFEGEKWLTPASPLLPGTCRARLLAQGMIHEADIRIQEIRLFKKIHLFNAMTDWQYGSEFSCEKIV
jgi:4-amino-4-deoxychorismate lyase